MDDNGIKDNLTFEEALVWLKNHHAIAREAWGDWSDLILANGDIMHRADTSFLIWSATSEDLLACDWKVWI